MIFARRQAETLAALGVDVDTFFLRSRTSPLQLFRELRRFRNVLRGTRPGVVHAHFGTVTALFAAIGRGRMPLVVTYRGSDLNPTPGGSRLRAALGRLFSQLAALRAQRIVCVSRQLRDRLWWGKSRARILPSGVNPDLFQPQDQAEARRALGWAPQDKVVLFNAGHDPYNKRLDLAQAAVAAARRRVPCARMEILNGQVSPALVPQYMNAADCLLVTSHSEGSPTVVQEALAVNLPIVSVEVGDIAERLQGVAHTRLVADEAEALGAAVADLLEHPVRSNGRDYIYSFSSHYIAQELCAVYRAAVAEQ